MRNITQISFFYFKLYLLWIELEIVAPDCLKQTNNCYIMACLIIALDQNIICNASDTWHYLDDGIKPLLENVWADW